jgi:hypothetical protein
VASARERGGKERERSRGGRKEGEGREVGEGGDWPRRAVSDRSSPSAAVGRPRGA